MKPRPKKNKAASPSMPSPGPVHFEFHDADAREVCLAGSFNGWRPDATPMVPLGHGRWAKELTLEAGVHEYLFVVDGRWIADPGAAVTVPNPFGGINCCVKVG